MYSYWKYEDFYEEIRVGESEIVLSWTQINEYVDRLIKELIKDFDVINAVGFCSFLNMVYQTREIDDTIKLTKNDIRDLNMVPKRNKNCILYHRINLLYLISLLIQSDDKGTLAVAGERAC